MMGGIYCIMGWSWGCFALRLGSDKRNEVVTMSCRGCMRESRV